MPEERLEEVLGQSPEGISLEYVQTVFRKNDNKVLPTLMELWDIHETQKKPKSKWDDIRETCDAYDMEMHRTIMSKLRASQPPAEHVQNEH